MSNDPPPASETRRKATVGVVTVAFREVAIRLLQFVGVIVLARLLVPHQFGVVAIGTSVVAFATFLADAGLGAALIRGARQPTREDLETLLGLQLSLATTLAVAIAAIGLPLGHVGRVTAVMACSLPLLSVRAPSVILLERALDYRPLVFVEVAEVAVYFTFAISTAAAGWGVWSLALGAVVRSAGGSALLAVVAPRRRLRPRLSRERVRSLVGFGARYQAVGFVNLLRDQGLNVTVAAIAGVATLGVWSLAYRILQVPYVLFTSLWRVSYPAMSRLIEVGENPRPIIERGVALSATATGLILAPLVGAAPALVPVLLGSRWHGVVDILPWPCLGLMIGGPVSVATAGYLYAVGDVGTPLRAALLHSAAWLGIALPLLPSAGAPAIGYGWLAASVVDTLVLGRAASKRSGARLVPALVVPTAVAATAGGGGWLVASSAGPTAGLALAGGTVALAVYVMGLLILRKALVTEFWLVTGRALRASVAGV